MAENKLVEIAKKELPTVYNLLTSPMKEIANARFLMNSYFKGWTTWEVNPLAETPYQTGVTLHWRPNMTAEEDKAYDKQIEKIATLAKDIAKEHGLEACVKGPSFAAGGAFVMYVGMNYPLPNLVANSFIYGIDDLPASKVSPKNIIVNAPMDCLVNEELNEKLHPKSKLEMEK